MRNLRFKPHFGLAVFLFLLAGLTVVPASAQDKPPVPEEYQQFFVHFVDDRSIKETAFNFIGLTSQDVGRSFALIAGVSYYPNMSQFEQQLKPAAEDLRKLQEYLRVHEFFDEIVVLKNQYMTYDNLEFFLQTYFPERLRKFPKSRFLFAYSGHGMSEGTKGYLLKNTARNLKDKQNSIRLSNVRNLIDEEVESGYHVLALINSCYSGAFLRRSFGNKRFIPQHPGAHAITAGGTDELAWHNPEVGTGSIFFEKFIAGLDGRADTTPKNEDGTSGDGLITVGELRTYLKQEIQIFTDQKQNPQDGDISKDGSKGGFFFLDRERQVVQRVVPEFVPDEATPFGIAAEKAYGKGKEYYQSDEYGGAFAYFWQAAEAGHAAAMNYIGYMYDEGKGVAENDEQAVYWYRKGAESGNASAMFNLGLEYHLGEEVTQDYDEALRWYRGAAEAGDADAMTSLGYMHRNGYGVPQDHAKALNWYRKGAGAGNALGMANLGYMYVNGYGIVQDYAEAVDWFRKGAEAGDALAMSNLGHMYQNGYGVTQNYAVAVDWFRQGAEAGDATAMYNLGLNYKHGLGVVKDREEAVRWFRKAAELGDEDAVEQLKKLGEEP